MNINELTPDFELGEQVVAFNQDGHEVARGPLMELDNAFCLEYTIGTKKVSSSWSERIYVFNAGRFDLHIRRQTVAEFGDVTEKYLNYARNTMTAEELDQCEALIHQLNGIVSEAAYRDFEAGERKGPSPDSFQGMWGNRHFTPDGIKKDETKKVVDRCRNSYSEVESRVRSLITPGRVISLHNGEPVKQSPLKTPLKEVK